MTQRRNSAVLRRIAARGQAAALPTPRLVTTGHRGSGCRHLDSDVTRAAPPSRNDLCRRLGPGWHPRSRADPRLGPFGTWRRRHSVGNAAISSPRCAGIGARRRRTPPRRSRRPCHIIQDCLLPTLDFREHALLFEILCYSTCLHLVCTCPFQLHCVEMLILSKAFLKLIVGPHLDFLIFKLFLVFLKSLDISKFKFLSKWLLNPRYSKFEGNLPKTFLSVICT